LLHSNGFQRTPLTLICVDECVYETKGTNMRQKSGYNPKLVD